MARVMSELDEVIDIGLDLMRQCSYSNEKIGKMEESEEDVSAVVGKNGFLTGRKKKNHKQTKKK